MSPKVLLIPADPQVVKAESLILCFKDIADFVCVSLQGYFRKRGIVTAMPW